MPLDAAGKQLLLDLVSQQELWISLHAVDPTGASGLYELSGGTPAYGRRLAVWDEPSQNLLSLSGVALFDIPANAQLGGFGLWNAETDGQFITGGSLRIEQYANQDVFALTIKGETIEAAAAIFAVPGVVSVNGDEGPAVIVSTASIGAETPDGAQAKANAAVTSAAAYTTSVGEALDDRIDTLVITGGGINSVNGVLPSGLGVVTLAPSDIGAAPAVSGTVSEGSAVYATASGGLKAGRPQFDFVAQFGADPTGVSDCGAAWANAIAAAQLVGGALIKLGHGTFKFTTGTRLVLPGDIGLLGEGAGVSTLRFTHVDGGLDLGYVENPGPIAGGSISGVTLDATYVARNVCLWGRITGWPITDLEVLKGGFDALDPDNSAAVIMKRAVNCNIVNLRINKCNGHGLIADRGSGGHTWSRGRIGEMGQAGANVHHFWSRRTGPGTDVYAGFPTDWVVTNVFVEGAGSGQDLMARFDCLEDSYFHRVSFTAGPLGKSTIQLIRYGTEANQNYFSGLSIAGAFDGSPAVNGTGIYVAAGAGSLYFTGAPTKFAWLGTGILSDNGPIVQVLVPPLWITATIGGVPKTSTVQTKLAGNLTGMYLTYRDRLITASAALTVADASNRGVLFNELTTTGSGVDSLRFSLRAGSASQYFLKDLLTLGFIRDYFPTRNYLPGEQVFQNSLIYRAKATILNAPVTFDVTKWDVLTIAAATAADQVFTVAPTGNNNQVMPAAYDSYVYQLTNTSPITFTTPPATPGTKLFELKNLSVSVARNFVFQPPGGESLVGRPDAAFFTGSVPVSSSRFFMWFCTTAGVAQFQSLDSGSGVALHATTHAPGASDDLTTALSATAVPLALGAVAAAGTGPGFSRQGHLHPVGGADSVEFVQDTVGAMAVAGSGISAVYSDAAGTLTIANTSVAASYVEKTADTTGAVSSTTLVDDPHLVTPSLAVGTYLVEGLVIYGAGSTADVKFAVDANAGATGDCLWDCVTATAATTVGSVSRTHSALGAAQSAGGVLTTTKAWARVSARVVLVLAGAIKVRWAQQTSNAGEGPIVYAGSWLTYRKVA